MRCRQPAELVAEVGGRGEPDFAANPFDAVGRALEKPLGVADPHAGQPLHGRLPGLGREAAIEGAHADGRPGRDVAQREVAVGLAFIDRPYSLMATSRRGVAI